MRKFCICISLILGLQCFGQLGIKFYSCREELYPPRWSCDTRSYTQCTDSISVKKYYKFICSETTRNVKEIEKLKREIRRIKLVEFKGNNFCTVDMLILEGFTIEINEDYLVRINGQYYKGGKKILRNLKKIVSCSIM